MRADIKLFNRLSEMPVRIACHGDGANDPFDYSCALPQTPWLLTTGASP